MLYCGEARKQIRNNSPNGRNINNSNTQYSIFINDHNNRPNRSNSTIYNENEKNNNPLIPLYNNNNYYYHENKNFNLGRLNSNDIIDKEYIKKHSRNLNITSDYMQCKSNKYSTIVIKHNKSSSLLNEKLNNNITKDSKTKIKPKNSKKNLQKEEQIMKEKELKDIEDKTKINKNGQKEFSSTKSNKIIDKDIISHLKTTKKFSNKECAFYILANSPILRLRERIIFSRSSPLLKETLSIDDILKKNEEFLQDKIDELKDRIMQCNNEISTPFTASKTADITLNFITMKEEEGFRQVHENITTDKEKNLYYDYYRIIYLLFNEDYPEKNDVNIYKNLYEKVVYKNKYISIRDYLYHIYIAKKQDNHILKNIDKINEIINREPNFFKIHRMIKMCKFVSFSQYLIQEIIKYGNNIQNAVKLKEKAENFLDIVYDKLDMYRMEYKNKKNKK